MNLIEDVEKLADVPTNLNRSQYIFLFTFSFSSEFIFLLSILKFFFYTLVSFPIKKFMSVLTFFFFLNVDIFRNCLFFNLQCELSHKNTFLNLLLFTVDVISLV